MKKIIKQISICITFTAAFSSNATEKVITGYEFIGNGKQQLECVKKLPDLLPTPKMNIQLHPRLLVAIERQIAVLIKKIHSNTLSQ
jgi:hypothetical protein